MAGTPKKQQVDTKNATIVKRGNYAHILKKIIADGLCPFCEKHLSTYHTEPILYRSKYWLITKNAWPYEGTKFHFLCIAIPHIEATEHIPSLMWGDLLKLYGKLVKEHAIKGATLVLRSGDTTYTGASVNHLHGHIISGSKRTRNSRKIEALVGFKK